MNDNKGHNEVQHFIVGKPVYDATGGLVGTVSNYIVPNQVLVVDKGPFRTENLYILLSEVQRSDTDGIYLLTGNDKQADT